MTEDVFGSDQTTTTTVTDGNADLLSTIVNAEGVQKYSTTEEALSGLKHGNEHISKLEAENKELRNEVDKRMSAENVLAELKAEKKPDETPSTEFSPEAIQELVDKRLEAKTNETRTKANEDHVQSAMRKKFGEKSTEIVAAKAQELGLSTEGLRQLSQNSPQAVLAMFGLVSETQESTPSKLHSTVRTDSFEPTGKRDYAWYSKLRKENPSEYRKQYPQMMKDAETARLAGEKF